MLNLSASGHCTVENVLFREHVKRTDLKENRYRSLEVIHLDQADKGESTATPMDGTHCEDITVRRCIFDHVMAGIGSHGSEFTLKETEYNRRITINDNTFIGLEGGCVNALAMTDRFNDNRECGLWQQPTDRICDTRDKRRAGENRHDDHR